MSDQVVSVRMPVSLVEELKELAEKNHYMDVSEELRSVLREKWLSHKDPYKVHLSEIKESVARKTYPDKIKTLKKNLKRLLEEIDEIQ